MFGAALIVLAATSLVALAGCASKKKAGMQGPGENGPNTLGEQTVPGGRSSMEQLANGTLGRGENGPLTDIHFDFNDFTVRAQDGEILRTDATWLTDHAKARVQVEGHCDERGSEDYNIALGAKRAQAAKDYLVTLGVAAERISTISYGKELPVCAEHEESCWARNRRAHFVAAQ
ncbi:MAG: peptidoglycan-associated lipoprotein Pal [Candidatus Binatales bacterium]